MSDPSTFHLESIERLNAAFSVDGDGLAAVRSRTAAVDQVVVGHFEQTFPSAVDQGFCVLAVGGYGRSQLFPHSDVDLLFLFGRESEAVRSGEALSGLLTALWDAQLRVSQSVRTPAECGRMASDNPELHISLLDARFLAGDRSLYLDLVGRVLPKFFMREQKSLMRGVVERAEERHREFGRTIYHLEPDVKEAPGGLRDFQTACWISQLANVQSERVAAAEDHLPGDVRSAAQDAKQFLFALRCYMHSFAGRDNNRLDFDLQETIAAQAAGKARAEIGGAADWMRLYYRNVRVFHRLALRMIEEHGTPKNSLLALMRHGRSKLSNRDVSVANGRLFFRYSHALEAQPEICLDLFEFVARHGIVPAARTERIVSQSLEGIGDYFASQSRLWPRIAEILRLPYAYEALAVMRETGALYRLFPELEDIDCLVIRDFYHRYTVDEHTVLTLRTLKRLDRATDRLGLRFAGLAAEVRRTDPLHLALLLHDCGKGSAEETHVERSVELADSAMERIGVPEDEQELVRFLVGEHLTMSNFITKRDISDPETVEEFVEIVGTTEKLRALTLLTYADTASVNPSAMTAWRKQLLWQLYMAAHNRLTGDVEDRRIGAERAEPILAAADPAERDGLRQFLAGFPERYLRTHTPEEVSAHFSLSRKLESKPVAVQIERGGSIHEVVVIAWDKPFLFSSLCAVLAGFGLNIERAEAFSNGQGLVLDSFSVTLPAGSGSFELDEQDIRQVKRSLRRVVQGKEDPYEALNRRRLSFGGRGRFTAEPEVSFDNETSSRATIFHVSAEDRTGLLFELTSAFSRSGCDIEVVLIETQGRKAIDVFYVTASGAKLEVEQCESLRRELLNACRIQAA